MTKFRVRLVWEEEMEADNEQIARARAHWRFVDDAYEIKEEDFQVEEVEE